MTHRLNQTGDTIIEVLLAIAIVSSVLGGAYVSSNRSLNASRQAEERVEALKLAEGQLERMKALAKVPTNNIHSAPNIFCIDVSTNSKTTTVPCADSSLGVNYQFSISRDPATNVFTITSRWDRLGGGQEELKLAYKLHP
jgi:type II secretory pathway component PulJ